MKNKSLFVLAIIVLCVTLSSAMLFVGCTKKTAPVTQAEPLTLNVFAAATLTEALNEIAELYKTAAPEVTPSFNFQSSGNLQTQIENGAEADLFLSAGQQQMNALAGGAYIDDSTRKDLLSNTVVLIVPQGSNKGIFSFEDCLTSKVSLIAFGNAGTPLGQYAEEIFKYLNGWDAILAKASLGATVKEVLSQVESRSVDCGIVWSTDAASSNMVTVVSGVPAGSLRPMVFPAAVVKSSPHPQAALAFLNYLSSPQAVAVFERIGFNMIK